MNDKIWIPKPTEGGVQYRLVRRFLGWQVEAWVGNQCIMEHPYWLKKNAQRHIRFVQKMEKDRNAKMDLRIKRDTD